MKCDWVGPTGATRPDATPPRGESQVRTAAASETCFGLEVLLLQCLVGAASVYDALAPAGRPQREHAVRSPALLFAL